MYGRYTYGAFNHVCINRNVLCISHDPSGDTMNRYIIDEEKLDNIADLLERNAIFQSVIDEHLDGVYNHPYNPQAERERVLGDVETLLDKLYWWYDCEPQSSVEFEEGACAALKHALAKIEGLWQRKDGD